ncbi:MAG: 50S ribosomal protein L6 [Candidatus Omnitrophica bacterium]|nr:50S ribosomal protein L6 [Candidatus Omnitrophota bacterium]
MSRIGKIPLAIPKEVKLNVTPTSINVEGPKGKLSAVLTYGIKVDQKDGNVLITRTSESKQARADHGTLRALLKNMFHGVTKGHQKDLEIQGLGFRGLVTGQKLTLSLGFSHPVDFVVPKEIKVSMGKPTEIKLEGADNILLGLVASKIRAIKPPEPYKGKGIRYVGEVVRRKQGKSVTK